MHTCENKSEEMIYAGIQCFNNKNVGGVYACDSEIQSRIYPTDYDLGIHTLYAIDASSVNIEDDGVVDDSSYVWIWVVAVLAFLGVASFAVWGRSSAKEGRDEARSGKRSKPSKARGKRREAGRKKKASL